MGRAQLGEEAEWGIAEHLLAASFDALQVANWQRAARKTKAPKPIPRPGVSDGERIGNTAGRSPEEIRAYLEQFKPKAEVIEDGG